jgi:hypothetical protein
MCVCVWELTCDLHVCDMTNMICVCLCVYVCIYKFKCMGMYLQCDITNMHMYACITLFRCKLHAYTHVYIKSNPCDAHANDTNHAYETVWESSRSRIFHIHHVCVYVCMYMHALSMCFIICMRVYAYMIMCVYQFICRYVHMHLLHLFFFKNFSLPLSSQSLCKKIWEFLPLDVEGE